VFVPADVIRRYELREGCYIEGTVQPGRRPQDMWLKVVERVNGMSVDEYRRLERFENLVTVDPYQKFKLETTPELIETRIIDLITPIGRGTRGLIVSPPRSGKNNYIKANCKCYNGQSS